MDNTNQLADEIEVRTREIEGLVGQIEAEAAGIKAGKAEIADGRKRLAADESDLSRRRAELGDREQKIATRGTELDSERRTARNMRAAGGLALVMGVLVAIGAAYWASQKKAAEVAQTPPPQQQPTAETRIPLEVVVRVPDKVVVVVEGPKAEEKKIEEVMPRPPEPTVVQDMWKSGSGLKLKCTWTATAKTVDCEGAEGEGIRHDAQGTYFLAKVSGFTLLSYYIPEQILGNDIKEDLPFGALVMDCSIRYKGDNDYAPYCESGGSPTAPSEFILPPAGQQPSPPLAKGVVIHNIQGNKYKWVATFERKKGSELCPVAFYAG